MSGHVPTVGTAQDCADNTDYVKLGGLTDSPAAPPAASGDVRTADVRTCAPLPWSAAEAAWAEAREVDRLRAKLAAGTITAAGAAIDLEDITGRLSMIEDSTSGPRPATTRRVPLAAVARGVARAREHQHDWLWHQAPDASRAPMVGLCQCGAINFDAIATWAEDRCKTAACIAERERDDAFAELELLQAEVDDAKDGGLGIAAELGEANADRDRLKADAARLRSLLRDALTLWSEAAELLPHEPGRRRERAHIARIREGAGLT